MSLRDTITQEVADLRAKADALIQTGQADAQKVIDSAHAEAATLQAQATSFESKLGNLPAELEALAEDAAINVWTWIKAL